MNKPKYTLTLDQTARYQIKIPGYISVGWADWADGITMTVENENADIPVTVLTGMLDQAALRGLLRRLYALGLPLISVICIDC